MLSNINQNQQIQFQGFSKFSKKPEQAKQVAAKLKEKYPDSFIFSDKKVKNKKTYFIITGKHQNKFLKLLDKVELFDLKKNIEKYMQQKADKLSRKEIKKLLKD